MPPSNKDNKLSLKPYWRPRYWLTWLGLTSLWLIVQLPYSWQLKIGSGLGIIAYHLLGRRRHITEVNIKLCFPELSDAERHNLVRNNFASLGIAVIETGMSWWMSPKRLEKLAGEPAGMEYVRAAFAKGKGIILLGAHLTTLDLAGTLSVKEYTFDVLYRHSKNKLIDTLLLRQRHKTFSLPIERHSLRVMLRQLAKNRAVWYAPDQDYGRRHSVFVPFFGVNAATITATSRLAKISGAAVIPAFQYRLPNGQGYELVACAPLENFPSGDDEADARRVNQILEEAIRKAPEQYLWPHRRFKTRPDNEPSFY